MHPKLCKSRPWSGPLTDGFSDWGFPLLRSNEVVKQHAKDGCSTVSYKCMGGDWIVSGWGEVYDTMQC